MSEGAMRGRGGNVLTGCDDGLTELLRRGDAYEAFGWLCVELAGGSLARWSGRDSGRLSKVGNPTEMVRDVRGVVKIGYGALWLALLVRPCAMGLVVAVDWRETLRFLHVH